MLGCRWQSTSASGPEPAAGCLQPSQLSPCCHMRLADVHLHHNASTPAYAGMHGHKQVHITTKAHVCMVMQELQGTEVLVVTKDKPKGVLLLFHGCGHGALDWWPASPGCPDCTGGTCCPATLSLTRCWLEGRQDHAGVHRASEIVSVR